MTRGQSSAKKRKAKTQKWYENGGYSKNMKRIAKNSRKIEVEKYPSEFLGVPTNGKKVLELAELHFPGLIPQNLPSANEKGQLFFEPPSSIKLDPGHPPYFAMRFDHVIPHAVIRDLTKSWDHLIMMGVKFPPPDKNRSSTPALHLGTWELSSNKPFVTLDTRDQTKQALQALDIFLGIVKGNVAPKLRNLLEQYCPVQHHRQMRAYSRVCSILKRPYAEHPALDFGGVFFTVAVKEGSSERIHLDFNDAKFGITWILPFGDWEGGEFCVAQLGIKIPIRPGQVLGVTTRILAHCSAPVTNGRRIILTLFTDQILLKHGDKYKGLIISG